MKIDLAIVWFGAIVFLFLSTLSLIAFSGLIRPMSDLIKFFDVATEANLWTWANVIALAAASYAHFCAAYSRWWHRRPVVLGWLLTAVTLAAMSLDDLAELHERLDELGRSMGGGAGITHFAWIVPGVIIAVAVIVIFVKLARTVGPRARMFLVSGIACFFAGAIGMEAVSGYVLSIQGFTRLYILLFHVEEFMEAIGAVLLVSAALADLHLRDAALKDFFDRPYSSNQDQAVPSTPT